MPGSVVFVSVICAQISLWRISVAESGKRKSAVAGIQNTNKQTSKQRKRQSKTRRGAGGRGRGFDQMSALKRRRPRRSAGCEPCKARRMKCSETKPACEECIKRGVASECSYSSDQIIFQSENAFIERSFKKQNAPRRKISPANIGIAVSTVSSETNGNGSGHSTPDSDRVVRKPPSKKRKATDDSDELISTTTYDSSSSPEVFASESNALVSKRQYLANDEIFPGHGYCRWSNPVQIQITSQESRALKAFFEDFLPCEIILGNHKSWTRTLKLCLKQHPTIRNITLAISRMNIGSYYTNYEDACQNRLKALEHYSQALVDLQQALEDPERALRDDTLLAVNLFGVYEMVKGSSLESLYKHVLGGLSILRLRGASSHVASGVTQSIAASYQGEAIRKSLENRTKTFFAEPDWIQVSRNWQPLGYNKWCGSELNSLLLRLTEVNAADGYDLHAAARLNRDIFEERKLWFPENRLVPNKELEAKGFRARELGLCKSVFGPDSRTFDPPDSATSNLTLASITFDYALLVLYHTYPSLQRDPDHGYDVMVGMMQSIQYVLHDNRNYTSPIIADLFGQIIHCCHWTRSDAELEWVLHCLDMSGVAMARKVGRLGKARIREGLESEDMKGVEGPKFGRFLEETGLDKSLNAADDSELTNDHTLNELGFRSNSFSNP